MERKLYGIGKNTYVCWGEGECYIEVDVEYGEHCVGYPVGQANGFLDV